MERRWKRRVGWLDLPTERIEELVRRAFPAAIVRGVEPLSGGLRNTNLRLALDGAPSPLVFRAYTADPDACCREASVLVSVDATLPAPHVFFAASDDEPPWALLECLEGVPADAALADRALADEALATRQSATLRFARDCGGALARIHELHFDAPGFLGPALRVVGPIGPWSGALPEVARSAGEQLGGPLLARIVRLARDRAADVDWLFDDPVLCHGDFKPWNMLAVPAGDGLRLTGILDWEFAFAGPGLFDVGTFLRDEARRPRGYAEAFGDGYRNAGGTLPPGWRRLGRLLDLINLCQLISHGDDRALADLRPLVEATLAEA